VEPTYDVFVSYPWADRDAVPSLAQALREQGLRVFVDDPEIEDFTRITTTITTSLAASRVLLAYYSKTYPSRRACQWELTAVYLAAQRVGDPSRRILVLNPEPGLEHLHPGELRDALAGRPPTQHNPAALAELAQTVADRVRELPGPLGAVAPLVPARWLPTQGLGSTRFVGRLPEMWRLHSALHPDTTRLTVGRTGPAVAQLRGLGGIGKTLLAEEYALRFGAAYPGGVFWLRAYGSHEADQPTTPTELAADHDRQVRAIAARLGLDVADRGPDEVLGALAVELERRGEQCLWVVDDLPDGLDAPQVQALLAPHPVASTLLTTRSRRYDQLAAVDLDVLPPEDALALLLQHRPTTSDQDQADAAWLVADLGYHALAVDVAGAALRTQTGLVSIVEFRAALQDPSQDELELAADLAKALPGGHQASIAATLQRSIRRLGQEGSDVLRLASVLAAAPLPLSLLAAVLQEAAGLDERAARRQASRGVAQAEGASLASPTRLGADLDAAAEPAGEGGWVVHALVARTMRFTDSDRPRTAALRAAAVGVLTRALEAIVDPRAHTSLRQVVPHARELARHPGTEAEAHLLGWVSRYDYERGDYRPAELAFRQALDAFRRLLGPEHPTTLTSMSNLADTLRVLGDAAAAADLNRQVLEARQRLLGAEHPSTLTSMNNLAETLYDLGDLAEAADLHRQALEVYQRVLGAEHPTTLISMSNLADTLRVLGDAAAAADLNRQVLEARQRLLGADHPETLQSMNNLAATLHALGDPAEAADLLRQVLEARQRLLGPEHPTTLGSMSNLAAVLHALGDAAAAADLNRRVLEVYRRLLGPEHPDTLTSMNNLAETLYTLGDRAEAADLHRQVLEARQRVLGAEHPTTLTSMNNLAQSLVALGDLAEAADLHRQALEVYQRVLGAEHPTTLTSMSNLAATLHALGDSAEAADLLRQVLEARQRLLGPEHPTTLRSMNNLAAVLVALGDLARAAELFRQAFDAYQRVLGPDHPTTRTVAESLAWVQRTRDETSL
jgi:tetratricopeptide (TPR) repeat protein